jgi:anti-sigma B factor antagonist
MDLVDEPLHATPATPIELAVSYPVPRVCVVQVAGELDVMTAPLLDRCVRDQLATGPAQLLIDLTAVTFLGSSGLQSLMESAQRLEAVAPGSMLQLIGTEHGAVHRPLELVGLLSLLSVHPTLSEALAQISPTTAGP